MTELCAIALAWEIICTGVYKCSKFEGGPGTKGETLYCIYKHDDRECMSKEEFIERGVIARMGK